MARHESWRTVAFDLASRVGYPDCCDFREIDQVKEHARECAVCADRVAYLRFLHRDAQRYRRTKVFRLPGLLWAIPRQRFGLPALFTMEAKVKRLVCRVRGHHWLSVSRTVLDGDLITGRVYGRDCQRCGLTEWEG